MLVLVLDGIEDVWHGLFAVGVSAAQTRSCSKRKQYMRTILCAANGLAGLVGLLLCALLHRQEEWQRAHGAP
jgi:hypothetical protein